MKGNGESEIVCLGLHHSNLMDVVIDQSGEPYICNDKPFSSNKEALRYDLDIKSVAFRSFDCYDNTTGATLVYGNNPSIFTPSSSLHLVEPPEYFTDDFGNIVKNDPAVYVASMVDNINITIQFMLSSNVNEYIDNVIVSAHIENQATAMFDCFESGVISVKTNEMVQVVLQSHVCNLKLDGALSNIYRSDMMFIWQINVNGQVIADTSSEHTLYSIPYLPALAEYRGSDIVCDVHSNIPYIDILSFIALEFDYNLVNNPNYPLTLLDRLSYLTVDLYNCKQFHYNPSNKSFLLNLSNGSIVFDIMSFIKNIKNPGAEIGVDCVVYAYTLSYIFSCFNVKSYIMIISPKEEYHTLDTRLVIGANSAPKFTSFNFAFHAILLVPENQNCMNNIIHNYNVNAMNVHSFEPMAGYISALHDHNVLLNNPYYLYDASCCVLGGKPLVGINSIQSFMREVFNDGTEYEVGIFETQFVYSQNESLLSLKT